ncbi:hypothetical protein EYF80_020156 [Liparis tanakae]|uniref:Uncharacterized protein n=1 Tax=Liparis tanakae TaxID=230148 RepID=A0A4Z2HUY5_9TELE|nr:hypothetical protein EYF80_020156 [Liparis tanakae]
MGNVEDETSKERLHQGWLEFTEDTKNKTVQDSSSHTDSVLLDWEAAQGPSIEGSSEIRMASSMAARRPFPSSPCRAGPKHSGRRISSLNTTVPSNIGIAFSHEHRTAPETAAGEVLNHLDAYFRESNLFLWRRAELLGLAGSESSRHVERLHDLVVAKALVLLQLTHKDVRKRDDSFYPVAQLAIAQVGQQMAELEKDMYDIFLYDSFHKVVISTPLEVKHLPIQRDYHGAFSHVHQAARHVASLPPPSQGLDALMVPLSLKAKGRKGVGKKKNYRLKVILSKMSMCPSKINLIHCPEFMDILSHFFSDILKLEADHGMKKSVSTEVLQHALHGLTVDSEGDAGVSEVKAAADHIVFFQQVKPIKAIRVEVVSHSIAPPAFPSCGLGLVALRARPANTQVGGLGCEEGVDMVYNQLIVPPPRLG